MDVAKYFDWCVNSQHHWLFFEDMLALFSECDDMLSSKCKVTITVELGSPFSGSQQMGQEQIVKCVFLHILLSSWSIRLFLGVLEFLHGNVNCLTAWLLLDFCFVNHYFVVHACEALHRWSVASICFVAFPLHLARIATAGSICLSLYIIFRTNRLLQFSNESWSFVEKFH